MPSGPRQHRQAVVTTMSRHDGGNGSPQEIRLRSALQESRCERIAVPTQADPAEHVRAADVKHAAGSGRQSAAAAQ
jgi:hypothetical protein